MPSSRSADLADLRRQFADFVAETAARAPLYSRLSDTVARNPETAALLLHAPPTQRRPVLFFAAVHALLLETAHDEPLRHHYPNLAARTHRSTAPALGDPGDLLVEFVAEHRTELEHLVATRSTQTNEIGRCATFLPALAMLSDEVGPMARIDVGTSAGLTLLLPHLRYSYTRPDGSLTLVEGGSAVGVRCTVHGPVPVPQALPPLAHSVGLDPTPIDVTDDEAVRWLEACVWPDQIERFERLVAAVSLARSLGLDVRRGDAVDHAPDLVREMAGRAHPVLTTSWVMNYLTTDRRLAFVAALDDIGRDLDLSWIIAEAPAQTVGLPVPARSDREEITVLSVVRWRDGRRSVDRLATAHPHGATLRWEAGATTRFSPP